MQEVLENIAIWIQQYRKRETPQMKLDLFLNHNINLPFEKSTNLVLYIYKIKVKNPITLLDTEFFYYYIH